MCPKQRSLIVEVDGDTHDVEPRTGCAIDVHRQTIGFRVVLRVTNLDVMS